MTLGEKIIELRKKEDLTQEKLASLLGVSRQTLYNWEGDITAPDIKNALKVVQMFQISLDDLMSNQVEICFKKNIFSSLIGKTCYLDTDINDYRLDYQTPCKVLDAKDHYLKIQFQYGKKTITKLLDIEFIISIKKVEIKEEK